VQDDELSSELDVVLSLELDVVLSLELDVVLSLELDDEPSLDDAELSSFQLALAYELLFLPFSSLLPSLQIHAFWRVGLVLLLSYYSYAVLV
jgi:hypothetical protein